MKFNPTDIQITPEEYTVLLRILPQFKESIDYYKRKMESMLEALIQNGVITHKSDYSKTLFNNALMEMITNIENYAKNQKISPGLGTTQHAMAQFNPLNHLVTVPNQVPTLTHHGVIHHSNISEIFNRIHAGSDNPLLLSLKFKFQGLFFSSLRLEDVFAGIEDPSAVFSLIDNELLGFYRTYISYTGHMFYVAKKLEKSFTLEDVALVRQEIISILEKNLTNPKEDPENTSSHIQNNLTLPSQSDLRVESSHVRSKYLFSRVAYYTTQALVLLASIGLICLSFSPTVLPFYKVALMLIAAYLPFFCNKFISLSYKNDHKLALSAFKEQKTQEALEISKPEAREDITPAKPFTSGYDHLNARLADHFNDAAHYNETSDLIIAPRFTG